jgi:hypothetical protein
MATHYFFRVFLADLDDQGHARDQQISFDSTFVVAASKPTEHDHDVEWEQDGRKKLVEIARLKQFASVVNNSANVHTIHTLFLLEQKNIAVATEIDLFKWDDKIKPDKQGNPSLIKLAKVLLNSKITGHNVAIDEDAYWFRFEVVGDAAFDDGPEKKGK